MTSPNGSKSASTADLSPLKGRAVTVWRDADGAGLEYARQVAKLAAAAGVASVAIVSPPADCKSGWDAADALAQGWTPQRAAELIAAAVPAEKIASNKAAAGAHDEKSEHDTAPGGRRRTPQRDVLIGLTEFCEFWHDASRNAYVTYTVNGHDEHWPVCKGDFREWLLRRSFEEAGLLPQNQALDDTIRFLAARAMYDGPEYETFTRVGRHGDKLFLDLCNARWRAVETTAAGWSVVENPPVKFLRSSSMRSLPEPEAGGTIEELRGFLNVRDDDFKLAVGWSVGALWIPPTGRRDCPVLGVYGEHGSAKSDCTRIIRLLVDPNEALDRGPPATERDLAVSASNSWVLAFDNLSGVPDWLSDALSRLATGSGFATRALHTNRDEFIFAGSRAIILNGIPLLTDRADLADRALTLHLPVIPEDARRSKDELFTAFEAKRPVILGALLDGVSAGLRNFSKVKLDRPPRMADFAKLITAAEPGLGWEPGSFLRVYRANRRDVDESVIEAEPLAVAIIDYVPVEHPDGWTGTATELLSALNGRVSEGVRRSKRWPDTAQRLGSKIDRVAPLLRRKGFVVERRHSGQRLITIVPPKTS